MSVTKEDYDKEINNQYSKRARIGSGILIAVILVGVAVLMFTGEVNASLGDKALTLKSTYDTPYTVEYSEIESVELREGGDLGGRLFGFQSAKLATGSFSSDEYGTYKRYTYLSCKTYIVIKTEETYVIVNAETAEQTNSLYGAILQKLGGPQ